MRIPFVVGKLTGSSAQIAVVETPGPRRNGGRLLEALLRLPAPALKRA